MSARENQRAPVPDDMHSADVWPMVRPTLGTGRVLAAVAAARHLEIPVYEVRVLTIPPGIPTDAIKWEAALDCVGLC